MKPKKATIKFSKTVSKCALDNPDLPIEFVKRLLISKHQDRSSAEPFIFERKDNCDLKKL